MTGILRLFGGNKDEFRGSRALVCAVDDRFVDLLKEDSEIYGRYYRATTTVVLPGIQALLGDLEQKFDIIHLAADLTT